MGRDKKDAESSKHDSSPYKRTAETGFGGRKSENIKFHAGIRQDSDTSSVKLIILKINYTSPVFAFSVRTILADTSKKGRACSPAFLVSSRDRINSVGVNAYALSAARDVLEFDLTVNKSKKGIVCSDSDIVAGMNVSSSLANEDISCRYSLTVGTLYAEALGLTVASVLGRTDTFFVCKEL